MTTGAVWPRMDRLLGSVERPARYIDGEWGARADVGEDAECRVALAYPDTYEIGQANQALQLLYAALNDMDGVVAERVFVPWMDMGATLRANDRELLSLESARPVRSFDILGITLPYELTYTNVLELLDLARIPLRSTDRGDRDPLVVGGGPCAFNPEPIAPFFDAILIGEGEEAVREIAALHRDRAVGGVSRRAVVRALSTVQGVYVPALYEAVEDVSCGISTVEPVEGTTPTVRKRVLEDLGDAKVPVCPIVPFMDVVHDRYAIEVQRGCTRGCRFCQAGMIYRPVRERTADSIVRDVMAGLSCTGYDEVSLTSLSTTDHSQIQDVVRRLRTRLRGSDVSISLPSLRVDAFGVEMARLASSGKKSGLTFAPEAGSQRLRDVINKNVTEEQLLAVVESAFASGWRRVKLYFMVGLPTETDEDVASIGTLVDRVLKTAREAAGSHAGSVRIAVSVSTFVPKSHTPFQWSGQIPTEEVRRRQALLLAAMPRKGVELSWHDPETSALEGVLARGDRSIADVVEEAWRRGARFDAWTEELRAEAWAEAFEACGVDRDAQASRAFRVGDPLPWSHIDSGVSEEYLALELERALSASVTQDCSFAGCTGCDVCDELGVDIVLGAGAREL